MGRAKNIGWQRKLRVNGEAVYRLKRRVEAFPRAQAKEVLPAQTSSVDQPARRLLRVSRAPMSRNRVSGTREA